MPHVESTMYSTTWSILQHYRDSVIMEDEDFDSSRRPASPTSQFEMGNPFESKKRFGSNGSLSRRYDFTPETLSPASPRASSPEMGYASSQTSASSYNEKRKQRTREIRARRSPNGSQNWPADLKLQKTNGATQLDEPNLPRWKYSPTKLGPRDAVQPPPLPPKNKLRNSLQRFPSNGSDQGGRGLRRRDESASPGLRPNLRVDTSDETTNMSLRQGLRQPTGRSRENSKENHAPVGFRNENPTGLRKESEPKHSHFSPDYSAGDEYNPYANPFGMRKDSREAPPQQSRRDQLRHPIRNDSLGSIDAVLSPGRKRKNSVDSFGDPKSARKPMNNRPRRTSTGSNYAGFTSPQQQQLSKTIRNQLRSPSDYGSPGAPPSSSYPQSSKRVGMTNKRKETDSQMTFSNLATPFSQPDYSSYHAGMDKEEPMPPAPRHRREPSDVSPRSAVPRGLPNPRRDMQDRDEPPMSARGLRQPMDGAASPPPPPPPPKMGLPTGPRDVAPVRQFSGDSDDSNKPLPLKPNRRGPPKVSELPKEAPKAFNMAPVAGLRKPSPPPLNNRMANSPSPGPGSSLRGLMRSGGGGKKGGEPVMEISSPTLIEGPIHHDLGAMSPVPRYGTPSSRPNPYSNPYGGTPTGPPQGYLSSETASSPTHSRDPSTRSGFSHQRNGSEFSSASSSNSIPVGTSAFGRLSSGTGAPTSNPYRRPAPSPGPPMPQHLNVTSDAGLGSGPYPGARNNRMAGGGPPKAPSSGARLNGMPSPAYRNAGPPPASPMRHGNGSRGPSPGPNGPGGPGRPLPGGNPRIGPPLPGHPGVGVTPLAHKRMASNFSSASGPGRVDQRRQDPNLAAAAMGGGPYPSSAPNSGGLPRRNGPPLPGPPGSGLQPQQRGAGGPPPGGRPPPNNSRALKGRALPPGAGFGLPGMPSNTRAGVPGRPQPMMRA